MPRKSVDGLFWSRDEGNMEITKSSRHQKVIGDFGESVICNWLSRSGFEVIRVDHTGIDIVAYRPSTGQRLGITVKSTTRLSGKENDSVNVLSYRAGNSDREKVLQACSAFACEPWMAVYVETTDFAQVYLTSLEHFDRKYRRKAARTVDAWMMGPRDREAYAEDPDVKHIRIDFRATNWSWERQERERTVSETDDG